MKNKDATWWSVLRAAIELDIKRDHLKWRMSDLSRASGVSRSLIYYYFGRDRSAILSEAIRLFGEPLSGIAKNHMDLWDRKAYAEALFKARQILERIPQIFIFYLLHRNAESEIGELIRQFEKKGIQKRKKFFPSLDDQGARALYSLQMGICIGPLKTLEEMKRAVEMIKVK
jgi:AcrR family transcriptional regulator